jgi:hypothetical protein
MEVFYKTGVVILLSFISALAYRCGGMGTESEARPKWIPNWLRHSWIRDWLCPLFVYGSLAILLSPSSLLQWGMLALCYPLLGGALSTYWDKLFGFDNFWFAGFMCGVAAFPLVFYVVNPWGIVLRAILLAILWGAWCAWQSVDYVEEMGRGAFLVLTIPLLLI